MSRIANTTRAKKQLGNALRMHSSLPASPNFFTKVTPSGRFYIVSHHRDKMISLMAAKGFEQPVRALKYGTDFSGYYFNMLPFQFPEIQNLLNKIDKK